jgi:hypothetical protein
MTVTLPELGPLQRDLHALHEEHAQRVEAWLLANQGLTPEEVRQGVDALHRELGEQIREVHRRHGIELRDAPSP